MSVGVQDKPKAKANRISKIVVDARRKEYEASLARQWEALPLYVIKRFFKGATQQVGLIEVQSITNLAFFKAIRYYNPDYRTPEGRPVQFNTYAVNVIVRSVNRFLADSKLKNGRLPTLHIEPGGRRGRGCDLGMIAEDAIAIDYKDIEHAHDAREEIAERMADIKPVHRDIFLDWLGGFVDDYGHERPQLSFVKLAIKYNTRPQRIKRVILRVHEQLGLKKINRQAFGKTSKAEVAPSHVLDDADVPDQQLSLFESAVA